MQYKMGEQTIVPALGTPPHLARPTEQHSGFSCVCPCPPGGRAHHTCPLQAGENGAGRAGAKMGLGLHPLQPGLRHGQKLLETTLCNIYMLLWKHVTTV